MDNNFDLSSYLSDGIEYLIKSTLKACANNPHQAAFIMKFALASKKAAEKRKQYESKGIHIPPFLIASITSSCNLKCKGCYAIANKACGENLEESLSTQKWKEIFTQAEKLGVSIILLAGGEPLMRRDVIVAAAAFKKFLFPVFTNGLMINDDYLSIFSKNKNLLPILSLEGNRAQTDDRRGIGTYDILTDSMKRLKRQHTLYGVSITVTTENIDIITSDIFIKDLQEKGCNIVFYVEYVPISPSTQHLAPTDIHREILDRRLLELRTNNESMLLISFPGDEKYTGGCLAAGRGFFHISAGGNAEPCPFSPYSDVNIKDCDLLQALQSPLFNKLKQTGMLLGEHAGGCLLFEKEEEVKKLLKT